MALNLAFHMSPGLTTVVARVEQLREPGQPRLYWDGAGKKWDPNPSSHLPVIEDPDLPGSYLIQESSENTRSWPNANYRITCLNLANDQADKIAMDPFIVYMTWGDDGGLGFPSVTVPFLGETITLWYAKRNAPPVANG